MKSYRKRSFLLA